jgi:tetratricopeptide (TPR) repeat protein
MAKKDARPPREARRHIVPPMPTWRLGSVDKPSGWLVLTDRSDELGVALWLAVRNVLAWADSVPGPEPLCPAAPASAARLKAAHEQAPELSEALSKFAALRALPRLIPRDEVSAACRTVAEWSDALSMFGTAAEFSEAAAKANPQDADYATLAGKACRRAGFVDRASLWYVRGFSLGLSVGNSRACVRALLGYGRLLVDQGKHMEARRYFRRAARRAHHMGNREQAAAAYHDLFTISAEIGHQRDTWEMLSRALRLYPIRHHQVPSLAHDFAFYLLREGYYLRANRVLRYTVPRLVRPDNQLIGWATYARTNALTGNRELWETARKESLARLPSAGGFAAAANIHLAEGARALEDWEEARARAEVALVLARDRGESLIEVDAQALLDAVSSHARPAAEKLPEEASRVDSLVTEMVDRLLRWKGRSAV